MPDTDDTLFTFIADFSRPASMVALLGSWDNFQRSYPLKKESRGGRETWRRYSDFKAIVCDGDCLRSPEESRDGSLKMGGTYWYYYQIDNDGEFCDPAMPTTRTCPFLPGQEVNILEVPSKPAGPRLSGESTTSLTQYTLDPDEKYRTRPGKAPDVPPARQNSPAPSPVGALKTDENVSTVANVDTVVSGTYPTLGSDSTRPKSPLAQLLRTPHSRDLNLFFSRSGWSQDRPYTVPMIAKTRSNVDNDIKKRLQYTSCGTPTQGSRPASAWRKFQIRSLSLSSKTSGKASSIVAKCPETFSASTPQPQTADHLSNPRPGSRPGSSMGLECTGLEGTEFERTLNETGLVSRSNSKRTGHGASPMRGSQRAFRLAHSNTTSTRSSAFYPSLDLSQEQTVATRSSPTTPASSNGGFSFMIEEEDEEGEDETRGRWCHPLGDNASVLTLQNVNKLPDSISTPTRPSRCGHDPASKRVKEWTAGIETSKSEVDNIAKDLSYLCSIIS